MNSKHTEKHGVNCNHGEGDNVKLLTIIIWKQFIQSRELSYHNKESGNCRRLYWDSGAGPQQRLHACCIKHYARVCHYFSLHQRYNMHFARRLLLFSICPEFIHLLATPVVEQYSSVWLAVCKLFQCDTLWEMDFSTCAGMYAQASNKMKGFISFMHVHIDRLSLLCL